MILLPTNINDREETELCRIMTNAGSDKGSGWHNYTKYYDLLFADIKNNATNIFELGLGTNNPRFESNMGSNGIPGASLRGWKEYFTNADIYGADIDDGILFMEPRIKTFFCDQTSPDSIDWLWSNLKEIMFDVIIEDGLHTFNANICFLENSIHKVKKGGFYIIEDISIPEINNYKAYLENCKLPFSNFEVFDIENDNKYDNALVVIEK